MSGALPRALLESAVDWMVLLSSGRATAEDRQRFEGWLAARDEHARAWAEVRGLMAQPLATLRAAPGAARAARSALAQPSQVNRRRLLQWALALPAGGALAWTVNRQVPLAELTADLATHTGERQRVVLEDGSLLVLNARSAADVRYDASERGIWLRRGEVYAEPGPDARPFVVHTDAGQVIAGQARLAVRRGIHQDWAHALQAPVQVHPAEGAPLTLAAPASAGFDRTRAWLRAQAPDVAWQQGWLRVQNDRLDEVVERLRAYQSGVIRVSPAAGALRVFGVFALDDPDRALQALGETLPIRVRRYGPWLTLIDSV